MNTQQVVRTQLPSRIDVIVRDANGDAFLFIEVKNEEEYATIDKDNVIEEQLFKLAGMERTDGHRVKYLVLYTTNDTTGTLADECIIIDNQKYPTYAIGKLSVILPTQSLLVMGRHRKAIHKRFRKRPGN